MGFSPPAVLYCDARGSCPLAAPLGRAIRAFALGGAPSGAAPLAATRAPGPGYFTRTVMPTVKFWLGGIVPSSVQRTWVTQ